MAKTPDHVAQATDRSELDRLEAEGEAAYDRMYDAHNYRDGKDAWDDGSLNLYRAIEEAKRLGLRRRAALRWLGSLPRSVEQPVSQQ